LRGKPAPDTFLEAARRLEISPSRAAVVEDAVAGVAAGHAGGFGAVIGVNRLGQANALAQAGATVVVDDLSLVAVSADAQEGGDTSNE
jgi:beta-phosphoglucomutase-like phosphatase (HAD superfamily)